MYLENNVILSFLKTEPETYLYVLQDKPESEGNKIGKGKDTNKNVVSKKKKNVVSSKNLVVGRSKGTQGDSVSQNSPEWACLEARVPAFAQ